MVENHCEEKFCPLSKSQIWTNHIKVKYPPKALYCQQAKLTALHEADEGIKSLFTLPF